jgi:CHASE3 domain sensor protein
VRHGFYLRWRKLICDARFEEGTRLIPPFQPVSARLVKRPLADPLRKSAAGAAAFSWLALASIPLILFLLGQLLASEFQQSRSLREAVDDSYRARLAVQRLLSIHQDMETGQRGFVVTGDESFLEPFERARAEVDPALAAVEWHIGEGSPLWDELQELRRLSAEKLRFSEQVVALRKAGREEEPDRLVAQGRGRIIMDQIRGRIARIAAAEEERVAASTEQAEAARLRSQQLTFILLVGLAVLLFAAAWANNRSMRAKRAAFTGWRISRSGRIPSSTAPRTDPHPRRGRPHRESQSRGRAHVRLRTGRADRRRGRDPLRGPAQPEPGGSLFEGRAAAPQRRCRTGPGISGATQGRLHFPPDVAVSPVYLAHRSVPTSPSSATSPSASRSTR